MHRDAAVFGFSLLSSSVFTTRRPLLLQGRFFLARILASLLVCMEPMSATSTWSSSCTSFPPESDLPGEPNTWNTARLGHPAWLLVLERSCCDFWCVPALDDAGTHRPFVGVGKLSVFCGIVVEGFGERLTGEFGADDVDPCALVVLTFL